MKAKTFVLSVLVPLLTLIAVLVLIAGCTTLPKQRAASRLPASQGTGLHRFLVRSLPACQAGLDPDSGCWGGCRDHRHRRAARIGEAVRRDQRADLLRVPVREAGRADPGHQRGGLPDALRVQVMARRCRNCPEKPRPVSQPKSPEASRDAGLGHSRGRGRNTRLHRAERRSNQRAALAAVLREPEIQPH